MAQTITIPSSSITTKMILSKQIIAHITVNTNLVDAGTNINAFTDVADVIAYVEQAGVQPVPADTGANLPALDSNAAPSDVGIVAYCQDADTNTLFSMQDARVPAITIFPGATGMTDGVVSLWGLSTTGVTVSGNLAVAIECTGGNWQGANSAANFQIILNYNSSNVA